MKIDPKFVDSKIATDAEVVSAVEAAKTELSNNLNQSVGNSSIADRDRSNHTGTQLASTISNFASATLAVVLAGLSLATTTAISATDSLIVALGKIQAQLNTIFNKLASDDLFLQVKAFRKVPNIVETVLNGVTQLTATSFHATMVTGTADNHSIIIPDATTVGIGHTFEVWNFSGKIVLIKDHSGNILANLKANSQTSIVNRDNSTSAGLWALSYTLDSGNSFGTEAIFQASEPEVSTNSQTIYTSKVTISTTSELAFGDYLINFQFLWRASNANKAGQVRLTHNDVEIINWTPFYNNVSEKPLLAGFKRVEGISGINVFKLEFKSSTTAPSTIYMSEARMYLWRIA